MGANIAASRFDGGRLRAIETDPYRIPFDDCSFDAVVSNQVMEHVQNKIEVFAEIDRVLKPGGVAVHVFPSRWSPLEHHILVPFASWMSPVPFWWLRLWAALGVRNKFQRGMSARAVAEKNVAFCANGICYWSRGRYERLSREVTWQSAFYIDHAGGGVAKMARRLHIPPLLVALFHGELMVVHKQVQQWVTMPPTVAKLDVGVPEQVAPMVPLA